MTITAKKLLTFRLLGNTSERSVGCHQFVVKANNSDNAPEVYFYLFRCKRMFKRASDNDYGDDKIVEPVNSLSDALALSLSIVSKLWQPKEKMQTSPLSFLLQYYILRYPT